MAKKEANGPEPEYDWSQDAGIGMEDVRPSDLALPIWRLLQSGSQECKRADPAYIPGAADGLWLDAQRRTLCESFKFIVCRTMTRLIEWKDRGAGGAGTFVRDWGLNDTVLQKCKSDELGSYIRNDNGNSVIPTPTFYGLVVETKMGDVIELQPALKAIIGMPSTQMKVARRWNTQLDSIDLPHPSGGLFKAPAFYATWRVASIPQSNEQGSWMIPAYEILGPTSKLFPDFIPVARDFAKFTGSEAFRNPVLTSGEDDEPEVQHRIEGTINKKHVDDQIPF